jgi:hypothetical protein
MHRYRTRHDDLSTIPGGFIFLDVGLPNLNQKPLGGSNDVGLATDEHIPVGMLLVRHTDQLSARVKYLPLTRAKRE